MKLRIVSVLFALAFSVTGCFEPAEPRSGKVHEIVPPPQSSERESRCKPKQWLVVVQTSQIYVDPATNVAKIAHNHHHVCMTKERAEKYKLGLSFP